MRTKNPETFKAIEEFVNEYTEKHGVSPTVREIHAGIGLAVGTVSRYLSFMRKNGMIDYNGCRNIEMAIGEIVWLITLMANQSILIQNLKNKDQPRDLLTEEIVELLTVPADLATYKGAITEALCRGTKRNIESESDAKNAVVG